jgi:hypothetical protein
MEGRAQKHLEEGMSGYLVLWGLPPRRTFTNVCPGRSGVNQQTQVLFVNETSAFNDLITGTDGAAFVKAAKKNQSVQAQPTKVDKIEPLDPKKKTRLAA